MAASTHRLATVSASEALHETVKTRDDDCIKLGLERLDILLSGKSIPDTLDDVHLSSGLVRGEVVELFGPPGVGKTALCIQATASTLISGKDVMWIDTGATVPSTRLRHILKSALGKAHGTPGGDSVEDCLSRLVHFTAPTLPHLLALLFHRPEGYFPSDKTALIVIDTISTPIDSTYPRNADERSRAGKTDGARWISGRRHSVVADIACRLAKLAAVQNVAILMTTNTVTRIKSDEQAVLRPAITGQEWDSAITRRVCLYRDWIPRRRAESGAAMEAARFAHLLEKGEEEQYNRGKQRHETAVAFEVTIEGIVEVDMDVSEAPVPLLDYEGRSRKRGREDESGSGESDEDSNFDYGWDLGAEDLVEASFV